MLVVLDAGFVGYASAKVIVGECHVDRQFLLLSDTSHIQIPFPCPFSPSLLESPVLPPRCYFRFHLNLNSFLGESVNPGTDAAVATGNHRG